MLSVLNVEWGVKSVKPIIWFTAATIQSVDNKDFSSTLLKKITLLRPNLVIEGRFYDQIHF